jgi:murein DD-endopeptidase MepM/ murein hydrolase activator NlpD
VDGIAGLAQRAGQLQGQAAPPQPGFAAALSAVTLGQMVGLAPPPPIVGGLPAAAVGGPAGAAAPAGPVVRGGLVLPVQGRFTSAFGPRIHPVTGKARQHEGVDLAAPTGTPFRAAAGGTVSFAGARGGYGNLVIVDHPDGTSTRYAHAARLDVRPGQQVRAGEVLGAVGSTGMSTGPHLHFELRRAGGQAVDPAPLLGL